MDGMMPDGMLANRKQSNGFVTAAFVCGILAIITTVCMTVYLPFVFAGLSFIFGALSKNKANVPMEKKARTGMICGAGGLIANVLLIVLCVNMVLTNPDYRSQLNDMCQQMYGITFDQMLDDMQNQVSK